LSAFCRGPQAIEGLARLATAQPASATASPSPISALPPLPSKIPSHHVHLKPITPDSPDAKPANLFSPQLNSGHGSPSHPSPSQIPSYHQISLSCSPKVSSGSHGRSWEAEEEQRLSSMSRDRTASHKGHRTPQGFGLPPIPATPAASSPPMPPLPAGKAARAVRYAALGQATKLGTSNKPTGKHSAWLKSHGSTGGDSSPAGARSRLVPGWNSDFSVQYCDPVSLKDQERVFQKKLQGSAKQLSTAAPCRGQQQAQPALHGRVTAVQQAQQPSNEQRRVIKAMSHCLIGRGAGDADGPDCCPAVNDASRHCGRSWGQPDSSLGDSRNLDSAQSPLRPCKDTAGCAGVHGQTDVGDSCLSIQVQLLFRWHHTAG